MKTAKYYYQQGIPVAMIVIKKGMKTFPLLGILQIIFVIAKIFDKLDWSWFMVFWPIWIGPAIVLGALALVIVFVCLIFGWALVLDLMDHQKQKRRRNKK